MNSSTNPYVILSEFRETLRKSSRLNNGNISFKAMVEYYWEDKYVRDELIGEIYTSGIEDGKVSFNNGQVINDINHHLDFSPRWQTYAFKNSSLFITGKGDGQKIKGQYTVRITGY